MSADTPTPSEKTTLSPAEELRQRMDVARRGGHEKYHMRLHEAGKLFVRERLDRLIDPGTMVEEGLLARCVDGDLAADAVVTVTGKIGGRHGCGSACYSAPRRRARPISRPSAIS